MANHTTAKTFLRIYHLFSLQTTVYSYRQHETRIPMLASRKTTQHLLDELERLRLEMAATIGRRDREVRDHSHPLLDELCSEVRRLRRELDCLAVAPPSPNCGPTSMSTASTPPFPPYPPYPPFPPFPPFPPYPPYPPNCGCCSQAPCRCAKCSGHAKASVEREPQQKLPEPSSTSSSSSSSSSSSKASLIYSRPLTVAPLSSSSSSIFSTNVK